MRTLQCCFNLLGSNPVIQASVSKTCLVRFDNNKYSVRASAVGRPVELQAYADRVVIRQDGAIVGDHPRRFGRGGTAYNPWHYVPVLVKKPGALRNGAPFKDWLLLTAIEQVRRKLTGLRRGARRQRSFRRHHPQHSGAPPRSWFIMLISPLA
jgi:hypothetical protein